MSDFAGHPGERRNCHCLTQITPIAQIEPVALLASILGWIIHFLERNDLGELLASRGRLAEKTEILRGETPAADGTGFILRNPWDRERRSLSRTACPEGRHRRREEPMTLSVTVTRATSFLT